MPASETEWIDLLGKIPGYDPFTTARDCTFDAKAGALPLKFFDACLTHVKGKMAGNAFHLMQWQQSILANLFGWKRPDGTRRYREAFIFVPRKNGKTSLCSGIALFVLLMDDEPGSEIYCLHPSTRILHSDFSWRSISESKIGDDLITFDENTPSKAHYRKLRTSKIESLNTVVQPCYKILFDTGMSIIASSNHLWLGSTSKNRNPKVWMQTKSLRPGAVIRRLCEPWEIDESREAGYLAGIFDGEGCLHDGKIRSGFRIDFAQNQGIVLRETRRLLEDRGFDVSKDRNAGNDKTKRFELSGIRDCFRFLGQIRPHRLLENTKEWYNGKAPNHGCDNATVTSIEYLGDQIVVAIGTTENTLFAEGLFSHNCAAADRNQAGLVFEIAKEMVLADKCLRDRLQPYRGSIIKNSDRSFFKPVSADVATKHGFNSHLVIADEVHAMPNRNLIDVLTTSQGARTQPLTIYITTSDYDRESICNEKYDYACKVRDGIIDDPYFLPVIYEASPQDDWRSPDVWRKANPCFGVSLQEEYVRRECQKAMESPSYENTFKRLQLNVKTEQDVRWLAMDKWDACGEYFDPDALLGKECYGGLDLASTSDVSALSLVFPNVINGKSVILPFFWIPSVTAMERARKDRIPYDAWAKQMRITLTTGNVADYDIIRRDIVKLSEKYKIREIAFDRWNATQLVNQLVGDGISMVQFGQGYISMSAPSKDLEKMILSQMVIHGGNPILRWMASNVSVEMDAAGNIKPSRAKSSEKIDGIVATIMALGRIQTKAVKRPSVYEKRGLLVL